MSRLILYSVLFLISIKQLKSSPLIFQQDHQHNHQTKRLQTYFTVTADGDFEQRFGSSPRNGLISDIAMGVATNSTGWSYVYAWSNGSYSDVQQAYSVGYGEASLDPQMYLAYRNSMGGKCTAPNTTFCKQLHNYLKTNLKFMKEQIISKRMNDPFWHQVELILWQIQGMDDGFKKKPYRSSNMLTPSKLDLDPFGMFFWHVSGGDYDELSDALKLPSQRRPLVERAKGFGHCSGLIKRVGNGKGQLFVSHDTWDSYDSMLRHMKLYEFNFHETANTSSPYIAGVSQSFSSYPGSVVSGDDFYILGSNMVSLETTNGFYNETLYEIIKKSADQIVFEFIRTQVANRLARNIGEWQTYFAKYNSGTYNNQWMVVDYKKVTPGQPLPSSGVLGVSEQLPGLVVSKDMSQRLKDTTYWPSYNTPAFPEIYDRSDMAAMAKKFGDFFVYNATPRAKIFRRDHVKVVDEASMIRLMRYNNFQHDPLSRCQCNPPYSGENGIAARSDLNPANGTYPFSALGHRNHGATDMKLATSWLFNDMGFIGVSSPTYDQQPPFKWSTSGFNDAHFGHPDEWRFHPIITPWRRMRGWNPKQPSFFLDPENIVIIPY